MVQVFPPEVTSELEGWQLQWARLVATGADEGALDEVWLQVHRAVRSDFSERKPTDEPVVQAVRKLFRTAGCDPTRYRPSSEALLRRVLRGDELPRIHPLVDLNNLVSLELRVPCCVVDPSRLEPPLRLRAGSSGESMQSMRGPFDLSGKPLLEDRKGPFGTPVTDSERVKVRAETTEAWLVAYLPEGVGAEALSSVVARLLEQAPVARIHM